MFVRDVLYDHKLKIVLKCECLCSICVLVSALNCSLVIKTTKSLGIIIEQNLCWNDHARKYR